MSAPDAVCATEVAADKRFTILEGTMKRHQYRPDSLLEVLHSAQQLFGFLEDNLLRTVARALRSRRAVSTASPPSTTSSR